MHRLSQLRDLLLGQPAIAVLGDHRDNRVDAAGHVRAAGGRVVVRRVIERLENNRGRLALRQILAVELLERTAREDGTRADAG